MIDLYFWPTPNGKRITIQLEEASIPYTIKPINIGRGDQLTPDFLKISPSRMRKKWDSHEFLSGWRGGIGTGRKVEGLKVAGAGGLPIDSGGDLQEVTHSYQVVGSGREGEGPTDASDSAMTSLAQAGDRLEPAEDLFHSFPPPLAEQVAGMASAASVDRAVELLRNVRRDSMLTQCAHQLLFDRNPCRRPA